METLSRVAAAGPALLWLLLTVCRFSCAEGESDQHPQHTALKSVCAARFTMAGKIEDLRTHYADVVILCILLLVYVCIVYVLCITFTQSDVQRREHSRQRRKQSS